MTQGHINNLYNTCFWSLIQLGGLDNKEAERTLAVGGHIAELEQADCISAHWQQTKMRYSSPAFPSTTTTSPKYIERVVLSSAMYVSVYTSLQPSTDTVQYELVDPNSHNTMQTIDSQAEPVEQSKSQKEKDKKSRAKARVVVEHMDIIKDDFWNQRPWLLSNKPGKIPKQT